VLDRLFRRKPADEPGLDLYAAVVAQARCPEFYEFCAVPDTVDGRFDMIALHVFLIMRRLKGQGPAATACSRSVVETMVTDMDRSLREMGVGDLGVPKRVQEMVRAFYGRVAAYVEGLDTPDDRFLIAALDRNLYGTKEISDARLNAMAAYVRSTAAVLDATPVETILAGRVEFAAPPVV
jgi:cytochrome b pre-mRNA-processing protein 3